MYYFISDSVTSPVIGKPEKRVTNKKLLEGISDNVVDIRKLKQ
jgi:hypothetical protein